MESSGIFMSSKNIAVTDFSSPSLEKGLIESDFY